MKDFTDLLVAVDSVIANAEKELTEARTESGGNWASTDQVTVDIVYETTTDDDIPTAPYLLPSPAKLEGNTSALKTEHEHLGERVPIDPSWASFSSEGSAIISVSVEENTDVSQPLKIQPDAEVMLILREEDGSKEPERVDGWPEELDALPLCIWCGLKRWWQRKDGLWLCVCLRDDGQLEQESGPLDTSTLL